MLTDSMTLEHITPTEVAKLREVMLALLRNGDDIGDWTDKTESVRGAARSTSPTATRRPSPSMGGARLTSSST